MPTDHVGVDGLMENEWDIVDKHRWWFTPFGAVSWSYPPADAVVSSSFQFHIAKPPYYHGSLFAGNASKGSFGDYDGDRAIPSFTDLGDDTLNSDLVGVRVVEEVVRPYEISVGFFYAAGISVYHPTELDRCRLGDNVDQDKIARGSEHWQYLAQELTCGMTVPGSLSLDASDDPRRLISQSAYGIPSSLAMSTPADPTPFTHPRSFIDFSDIVAEHRRSSPTTTPWHPGSHPRPFTSASLSSPRISDNRDSTRSLTRSLSPVLASFPVSQDSARYPRSSTVEKDNAGFYRSSVPRSQGETVPSTRPSSALLPSFLSHSLRQRKPSKTRAIADLCRSPGNQERTGIKGTKSTTCSPTSTASCSPSGSTSTFNNLDLDFFRPRRSVSEDGGDSHSSFSSPSAVEFEEDDDGWIRPGVSESENAGKAQRTKELCSALTRHRCDSTPSRQVWLETRGCNDDTLPPQAELHSSNPPFSARSGSGDNGTVNDDGWIEGPSRLLSRASHSQLTSSLPPRHTKNSTPVPAFLHRAQSQPCPAFPANVPTPLSFPVPPTPYFPAFPYPTFPYGTATTAAAATYLQFQMQMQIQSQIQFQLHLQAQTQSHPRAQPHGGHIPGTPMLQQHTPPLPLYPTVFSHPQPHLGPVLGPGAVPVFGVLPGVVGNGYNEWLYADSGNITGTSGMRRAVL